MKIMWVKSGGFLPLDAGGKIRSFNLARELSRRHETSVFTFYACTTPDPHDSLRAHFHEADYFPLRLPGRASVHDVLAYAANSITSRPYQMVKYCRPEVARRLREKVARNRFDLLICDFLLTAGVLPWDLRVPTVIFAHNVEAVIWKHHLLRNRNLLWRLVARRECRAVSRFERYFTGLATHVLTVSDDDRSEFLRFLSPDKVSTIPTGVDLEYFRPYQTHSSGPSLVFTGSMDWKPNEDGILYFVSTVLPLIQKHIPDVVLRVIGRNPSRKVLALKERNPAIQVTGPVEDVRPYVHDSTVYVVPIRIGSGTRIKIFEAMAMGVPVVSTTLGAEGLQVQHGQNILLADDPVEFAGHVLELFKQPMLHERIARRARFFVESGCSWSAAADVLDRTLRNVVQRAPSAMVNV